MIVLGGGQIGIELSQALNRLGVKVSVVEMMDRIFFREDKEISVIIEESLRREGLNILTGRKAVKFYKNNNKVCAVLESENGKKEEINADNVLSAVGRAPNMEGLNLEEAGVEYSKKGVNVNEYLQTTNEKIFACGDIVGPYMFSHVAAYQASVCVRNALMKRIAWQKVNYDNIVWASFTEPEVSRLGLTEDEARKKYGRINVYKSKYDSVDRAVTDLVKDGLVKVITDKKGYILGANIVGYNAGEIIQGLLIAKSLKIPFAKLAQVLYIYPTLSELVKKTAAQSMISKLDNPFVKFIIKIMKR